MFDAQLALPMGRRSGSFLEELVPIVALTAKLQICMSFLHDTTRQENVLTE